MSNDSKKSGRPLTVIINSLAVFLVSQLIAGMVVGLIAGLLNPKANVADLLTSSTLTQFFFILVAESLAVGLVLLIIRRRKLSPKAIGLRQFKFSDLSKGAIGFLVFYVLLITASIFLTIIFPDLNKNPQNVGFNNIVGDSGQILALISLVILPPLGEEILVRGYLFSGLRSKMSFVKAGLITSLLFSIAHLQLGGGSALVWGAAVDTFVLSLVLVYLREKTGALYAGMMVHMLNNLVAFIVKFH